MPTEPLKTMKTTLLLAALSLALMSATCDRNNDDDDDSMDMDPKNGVIVINTPAPGNTFAQGDTVWIRGYITHPGNLHGYEIHVGTDSDNDAFYKVERHVHGSRLDFNEWFINRVGGTTDAILKVEAKLGHGEGDFEREIVVNLRRD